MSTKKLQIVTPIVTSVNDKTGNVTLESSDITGLTDILSGKADRKPLLELDTTTRPSMNDYVEAGMYWINPDATSDAPNGNWGFLRVFTDSGNILQEYYAALSDVHGFRVYVNSAWQAWHLEYAGIGNGWNYTINPDGSVDLYARKQISSISCTTALGSWYRTGPLPRDAMPFAVTDQITSATYYPTDGYGGVLWCLGQENDTLCCQYYLVRHTSVSSITGVIEYHVHGRIMNSGSLSGGTRA